MNTTTVTSVITSTVLTSTVLTSTPGGVPAQGTWYSRPGLPRGGRPVRPVGHETDHGFCSVCGAVWPCARARREQRLDGAAG